MLKDMKLIIIKIVNYVCSLCIAYGGIYIVY